MALLGLFDLMGPTLGGQGTPREARRALRMAWALQDPFFGDIGQDDQGGRNPRPPSRRGHQAQVPHQVESSPA
jgi:hypothetical protein